MVKRKLRRGVGLLPLVLGAADPPLVLRALLPMRTAALAASRGAKWTLKPSCSVLAVGALKISLNHFFSLVVRLVLIAHWWQCSPVLNQDHLSQFVKQLEIR